jgi:hypothetical protein
MAHLATTLLRLARLLERRNQPARAAEAYRRLLETWRDHDPDLAPQITALRARVESLTLR